MSIRNFTLLTIVASATALALFSGCHANPNYCPGLNANNNCAEGDGSTDAPKACKSNSECSEPNAVCDVAGSKTCVQCTISEDEACTDNTPICGGTSCRACRAHSECPESACLPDGSCADPALNLVAYVEPAPVGSDNTECSKTTPCTRASRALDTARPYIKFKGTTDEAVTVDNGQVVTFLAEPNAKLVRMSNGSLLRVEDASRLTIYDLEISGELGVNVGISIPAGSTAALLLTRAKVLNNVGGAISAASGTLTIVNSIVAGNTGGGVSIAGGAFVIVGNVFFNNGTQTGAVGGISISTSQNAINRLEFNSFNKNQTQLGVGAAIHCAAGTFSARNNIMSENGTLTNLEQVSGGCTHSHSIVRPGTLPGSGTNSAADPLFEDTASGDLHLKTDSPARGFADSASDLTGLVARDLDGDARVAPADIGADEAP